MKEKPDLLEGLSRDGHRLQQVGALLFLLGLLVGLGVPRFAVPRLALSTHLLGITQGTLLMVVGMLWSKLRLTGLASRTGRGLAIYGCLAAWSANLLGALWAAGNSMLPIAAGTARGTGFQEGVIRVLLVSAALSLISVAGLILWGLRMPPPATATRP
jgi:(hydroxyamino)benzene mutase